MAPAKLSATLSITLATWVVLLAAHGFAEEDVFEGGHKIARHNLQFAVINEHAKDPGAESQPPEEGIAFEGNMEASICFLVVLLVMGLSQCHSKWSRGVKKADKMGYVADREEDFAELLMPRKRTTAAPAQRKVAKPMGAPPWAKPAEERLRFNPEKAKYTEVLSKHAKALNVDGLEDTIQEMERRFGPLLMTDYSLAISHIAKGGEPIRAHKWLDRAMNVGNVPSQRTFSSVIDAYVKKGNLKQAFAVADDMKGLGLEFDTITYNTLIEAWARAGDAATCQLWMKKMLAAGVKPSVVTFGSVMRACANAGLTAEIEEWYELSHKLGIELNLICFSSVMNAFARREDLENAMKWLGRCTENGVQPNLLCFISMLKLVLNKGDFDVAAVLIQRMRAAGVQPDGGFFSQCLIAALRYGQLQRAQDWADECVAYKFPLTKGAELAMSQAGLRIPKLERGSEDTNAGRVAARSQQGTARGSGGLEREEQMTPEDQRRLQEARVACIGKRYQGTIKEFIQHKFGFIRCDETFAVFQRDIFLGSGDNPELLAKGQRVSFVLRVDSRGGFPRASNVTVDWPSI